MQDKKTKKKFALQNIVNIGVSSSDFGIYSLSNCKYITNDNNIVTLNVNFSPVCGGSKNVNNVTNETSVNGKIIFMK
jgi:hypothetical protein